MLQEHRREQEQTRLLPSTKPGISSKKLCAEHLTHGPSPAKLPCSSRQQQCGRISPHSIASQVRKIQQPEPQHSRPIPAMRTIHPPSPHVLSSADNPQTGLKHPSSTWEDVGAELGGGDGLASQDEENCHIKGRSNLQDLNQQHQQQQPLHQQLMGGRQAPVMNDVWAGIKLGQGLTRAQVRTDS